MRHRLACALTLFSIVLPLAAASADVPTISRAYKQWSLVCDNGRRCVAGAYGDGEQGLVVELSRDAGPDGRMALTVRTWRETGPNLFYVDGKPLAVHASAWHVSTGNQEDGSPGRQLRTTDPAAIAAWVAAARQAKNVSLDAPDSDAPQTSLDGFSATLLAMDDAQGRVGTVTALVRKGDRPASDVPAAPSLPPAPKPAVAPHALSAPEAKALIAATVAQQREAIAACAEEDGADDAAMDERRSQAHRAFALSADEALVAIACDVGSAYNWTQLWYRVQRKAPHAARPLDLGEETSAGLDSSSHSNELTNSGYDSASASLQSFAKLRGVGDCGSLVRWVFDGKDFVLVEKKEQSLCAGVASDDWPTFYRTR